MNTDLLRRKAVMLSEQRLGLWLGNIVIVPITAMVVMQEGAGVRLLGWVVAQYLLTLVRLADWRHMRRQPPREASAILRWFHQLTAFAFIGGALWGLCAWWFLDLGDIHRAVYIIVLLISIGTASLTGLAAWLPAYVAFVAPIALFVAASLFASGETAGEALAIACIAYFVATCIFARNYARTIDTVVLTNLENARLLADAERASLQKSNFVAAVSHDVRQPLYALGLFLEGLRNQLDSPSQIAIFEQARDAHRAVDDMFSALLEVSRLDAGAVVPALSHFRLGGVLDAIVAERRPDAESKGLRLECERTEAVVVSDPILLARVLRNLLGNAVKYTAVGRVAIGVAERDEGHVDISVSDSGRGIPAERQQAIFDEYVQLDNPERDRRKGLGLGLAIVRRVCEVLEHPLALESTVGRGSRFTLTVPRGRVEAVIVPAPEAAGDRLAGVHVLVIDDEEGIRNGMALMLGDWGCTVSTAGDVDAALTAMVTAVRPVDLLVCDYRLRGHMTGIEAIAALRDACGEALPALIMTGDTDPAIASRATAADLYLLTKPIRPAQLRFTLSRLLG